MSFNNYMQLCRYLLNNIDKFALGKFHEICKDNLCYLISYTNDSNTITCVNKPNILKLLETFFTMCSLNNYKIIEYKTDNILEFIFEPCDDIRVYNSALGNKFNSDNKHEVLGKYLLIYTDIKDVYEILPK